MHQGGLKQALCGFEPEPSGEFRYGFADDSLEYPEEMKHGKRGRLRNFFKCEIFVYRDQERGSTDSSHFAS